MPVAKDTRGIINWFIKEYGEDYLILRIPVGSEKKLPDKVRKLIKTTVEDAGWQVWRFTHEKCQETKGIRKFVIIRKITNEISRD